MNESHDLIINRTFDAPIERVWAAWTEPEQLMKWWGPEGFTAPTIKNDFQVGGKYLYCMRGAVVEGGPELNLWSTGTYREIVPMKKIVTTDNFSDAEGNVIPASEYGLQGDWPETLLVTTEFEATEDGKTKLKLTHTGAPTDQERDNMETGWNQSLDKLAASL